MKYRRFLSFLIVISILSVGQLSAQDAETRWVDSVYNSLTLEQRVGQLIMMRANQPDKPFETTVGDYIQRYNIGAVCFFRADAVEQLEQTNAWQALAQTPLMVAIDAEWGLAMRVRNTVAYPYQMTLGAVGDNELIYLMGQQVADQCQRMGIHVNFAPVADVNSNAKNPVIGVRSFGENPQNVGEKAAAYALGMQSKGLITSMKHFPGHGNTDTDSHATLPTVNRSYEEVKDIELAPFRYLIQRGVNGAMVGHLYFPAIEKVPNTSSSLSKGVVTDLLKDEMGFEGLIFTDGLDMKGVSQTVPADSVSYVAFLAGNDVLILPRDVPKAIAQIKAGAERDPEIAARVEEGCKKILKYKYRAGLSHYAPKPTQNLMADLNHQDYLDLRQMLYDEAVTLLRNEDNVLPLKAGKEIAMVTIGTQENAKRMVDSLKAAGVKVKSYCVSKDHAADAKAWLPELDKADLVMVNIMQSNINASKNFGVNDATVDFFNRLVAQNDVILNLFACPYALDLFRINNSVIGLTVGYQDNDAALNAVMDLLTGKRGAHGTLPVSTEKFKCGEGIVLQYPAAMPASAPVLRPGSLSIDQIPLPKGTIDIKYERLLDSVAKMGIEQMAYPGCQVLAMKDGKVVYDKCFGTFTYDSNAKVVPEDVYDIASLTKIFASTLAIMKLYEDTLLDINKTMGDYFPYLNTSDKGAIKIIDILTHQSGMKSWIPFHQKMYDKNGPKPEFFIDHIDETHTVRVAENLYLVNDYKERIVDSIMKSPMKEKKYVYCDMGFYFVPELVKQLTNMSLEEYLQANFYEPMHLTSIGYCPLHWRTRETIIPTENDTLFRKQLLWGDVHDQMAALMGGVSGHAGLFANAHDLAVIAQMLMDEGKFEGKQLLKPETIKYFTTAPFTDNNNRRGLGFDKLPIGKKGPSTASKSASMASYGHTGFTGTFFWNDPENHLLIIFLSNRVCPSSEPNNLSRQNIRTLLHDILYQAFPGGER
jgi:beta-glucosidase-like glycosyl hydrolase/CubicO group peptidase (beta-lactamase class C family)